jgi:hypothetical protein
MAHRTAQGTTAIYAAAKPPPGRADRNQVAWVLNCQPHDLPILVAARPLKPLGSPPPNSVKFFAASDDRILVTAEPVGCLTKARCARLPAVASAKEGPRAQQRASADHP